MKKLVSLVTLLTFFLSAKAQTRGFGNIDTADLRLSSCDFEKGANAEVLFDKAYVHYNYGAVVMDRHTRIKIFTDKGKDDAKVRIEFYGAHKDEEISDIEAETINLNNDVITYSPVDKTTIYTEKVDQDKRAIVFTFPNVKPGSIVEYKYRWHTPYSGNYPDWVFQHDVPTRYSELQAELTNDLTFKLISKVKQKFALDTIYPTKIKNDNGGKKYVWALNNVHSYKEEPFMTAIDENVQALYFQVSYYNRSWFSLTNNLLSSEDFGKQLDTAIDLTNENTVLNKMQSFKTTDEKIGYAFNLIKSTIQWNDYVGIYTDDGIKKTWNRKKGAASDINLLVYHFLKKSGVNAYPIAVNTHRKIETGYASLRQCNKTIVFVKVDSTRQYILDASEKDNVYNDIPYNLLNSNGLLIDPHT